jgi:hypothetical protein
MTKFTEAPNRAKIDELSDADLDALILRLEREESAPLGKGFLYRYYQVEVPLSLARSARAHRQTAQR